MKYCPECGGALQADEQQFCSECGARVSQRPASLVALPTEPLRAVIVGRFSPDSYYPDRSLECDGQHLLVDGLPIPQDLLLSQVRRGKVEWFDDAVRRWTEQQLEPAGQDALAGQGSRRPGGLLAGIGLVGLAWFLAGFPAALWRWLHQTVVLGGVAIPVNTAFGGGTEVSAAWVGFFVSVAVVSWIGVSGLRMCVQGLRRK